MSDYREEQDSMGSVRVPAGACECSERTVSGFEVNNQRLQDNRASNPILVTALNAVIGYDAAATIAKRCYLEGRAALDAAAEETELTREELEQLLNPLRLTGAA